MKTVLMICIFVILCKTGESQNKTIIKSKPFVIGKTIELQSKILQEKRTLNIYLPSGYNEKDTAKYNVIYLLDGSADEDFIHIAGIVQFLNFPWIQSIPNSIIIGIANVDRRRDFTFPTTIAKDKKDFPSTGKSENFILFIEKELQPFINKNFKTNTSNTIIGQSLGGLLASEILFKKPQLFSSYIIVSPSLWWDNESLLAKSPFITQQGFIKPISIYIAIGNEGKIMEADAKKLADILNNQSNENLTVNFEYFNNENHASILHNAVYKGLEKINKKKDGK